MAAKRGWAALAQDWAMDEQGRDPSGKFSAAKFYAPAQDAQDCWASMAKDWGPSCAKKAMDDDMGDMSAMDAGDGWSAMCAGWGGGAAAMDADFEESKHPRADNGQFGAGAVGSSKAGLSSNKMTNHKLPTKTGSKVVYDYQDEGEARTATITRKSDGSYYADCEEFDVSRPTEAAMIEWLDARKAKLAGWK
jgi:hypothetical protein